MTDDVRLHPPDNKEKFLDGLVKEGLFESKAAAMMFAAAIGRRRSERPSPGKAGEGIRWQVFERNQDTTFIYALAIEAEKSISVLESDRGGKDKICQVFQEYAAGGLEHLQQRLSGGGGDPLDVLLLLVAEARQDNLGSPVGLEGLSAGAIDALGL